MKTPEQKITDLSAKVKSLKADRAALYKALKLAEEHLEFCGYGDSYEREGAMVQGLPEKIQAALYRVEAKK